jgi:hypothetical protein
VYDANIAYINQVEPQHTLHEQISSESLAAIQAEAEIVLPRFAGEFFRSVAEP